MAPAPNAGGPVSFESSKPQLHQPTPPVVRTRSQRRVVDPPSLGSVLAEALTVQEKQQVSKSKKKQRPRRASISCPDSPIGPGARSPMYDSFATSITEEFNRQLQDGESEEEEDEEEDVPWRDTVTALPVLKGSAPTSSAPRRPSLRRVQSDGVNNSRRSLSPPLENSPRSNRGVSPSEVPRAGGSVLRASLASLDSFHSATASRRDSSASAANVAAHEANGGELTSAARTMACKIEALSEKLERSEAEKHAAIDARDTGAVREVELREKVLALEARAEGAEAAEAETASARDQVEAALSERSEALRAAEATVSELQTEVRAHEVELRERAEAIEAAEAEVAALEEKNAVLEQTKSNLEANIAETTSALAESEAARLESDEARERMLDERERLLNEIDEMKGCVRVVCRLRPPKKKTAALAAVPTGELDAGIQRQVKLLREEPAGAALGECSTVHDFDRVFAIDASTEHVFDELGAVGRSVLNGGSAAIMAYGQTGSGKTYTMEGFNRLMVSLLLNGAARASKKAAIAAAASKGAPQQLRLGASAQVQLRMAVVEVQTLAHAETLVDLLLPAKGSSAPKLEVRSGMEVCAVSGLGWHAVKDAKAAHALAKRAAEKRATADNGLNQTSSRSHMITLYQLHSSTEGDESAGGVGVRGQLALVDLAGSERLQRTGATGDRRDEAVGINGSLTALGQVMLALVNKAAHVPFRNSLLTHLLQPCMRKGCRVALVVNASPEAADANETEAALGFGTRARKACLGSMTTMGKGREEVAAQQRELQKSKLQAADGAKELAALRKELEAARASAARGQADAEERERLAGEASRQAAKAESAAAAAKAALAEADDAKRKLRDALAKRTDTAKASDGGASSANERTKHAEAKARQAEARAKAAEDAKAKVEAEVAKAEEARAKAEEAAAAVRRQLAQAQQRPAGARRASTEVPRRTPAQAPEEALAEVPARGSVSPSSERSDGSTAASTAAFEASGRSASLEPSDAETSNASAPPAPSPRRQPGAAARAPLNGPGSARPKAPPPSRPGAAKKEASASAAKRAPVARGAAAAQSGAQAAAARRAAAERLKQRGATTPSRIPASASKKKPLASGRTSAETPGAQKKKSVPGSMPASRTSSETPNALKKPAAPSGRASILTPRALETKAGRLSETPGKNWKL